jgi:hypothetical protein
MLPVLAIGRTREFVGANSNSPTSQPPGSLFHSELQTQTPHNVVQHGDFTTEDSTGYWASKPSRSSNY